MGIVHYYIEAISTNGVPVEASKPTPDREQAYKDLREILKQVPDGTELRMKEKVVETPSRPRKPKVAAP